MNSTLDFIIVNLKVIGQTPRNRRLRMTSRGSLTLENDHLLVPFKRRFCGDGREKLIRDVTFLLNEVSKHVRLLISSKHLLSEVEMSPEGLDAAAQLESLYRELGNSLKGFQNLMDTYENDKLMVGELELIVDKIHKYMSDIMRKMPHLWKPGNESNVTSSSSSEEYFT